MATLISASLVRADVVDGPNGKYPKELTLHLRLPITEIIPASLAAFLLAPRDTTVTLTMDWDRPIGDEEASDIAGERFEREMRDTR